MKISELFEAISIADFVKNNNIPKDVLAAVVAKVKESAEYKKAIKDGYKDVSSKVHTGRATFAFEFIGDEYSHIKKEIKSTFQFIVWPSGVVRFKRDTAGIWADQRTGGKSVNQQNMLENLVYNVTSGIEVMFEKVQKLDKEFNKAKSEDKSLGFENPPGVTISSGTKMTSMFKVSKDPKFKYDFKRASASFSSLNFEMETGTSSIPDNFINWKSDVDGIYIDSNTPWIGSLDNLPKTKRVSFSHATKIDPVAYLEKLHAHELSFHIKTMEEFKSNMKISLPKAIKHSIEVRFYIGGGSNNLGFVNDYYANLEKDKTKNASEKMLELQQWLIDNDLDNLAK